MSKLEKVALAVFLAIVIAWAVLLLAAEIPGVGSLRCG